MEHKHVAGRLGQKVREARKSAKLNGQELAGKIGMSQSYISEIERGNRNPSLPTLLRIASVLQRPISYFLSEEPSEENVVTPKTEIEDGLGACFSQALNEAMDSKQISQVEFCQKVGIRGSDLRRYAMGFVPSRQTVMKMAEVLDMESSHLLWHAGYLPSACVDERLRQVFNDDMLRAAAFKLATEFNTEEGKELVLKVLETAKEELSKE